MVALCTLPEHKCLFVPCLAVMYKKIILYLEDVVLAEKYKIDTYYILNSH